MAAGIGLPVHRFLPQQILTDDRHTAFGHTPGFNSVLVRVSKHEW
jgi:hypothetical protein